MVTTVKEFSCEYVQQRLQEDADQGMLLTVPEQTPLMIGDVRWYRVIVTDKLTNETVMRHVAVNEDGSVERIARIGVNHHGIIQLR